MRCSAIATCSFPRKSGSSATGAPLPSTHSSTVSFPIPRSTWSWPWGYSAPTPWPAALPRTPLFEGAVNRGENWTDPVIGTRLRHNFTNKAFLIANGDIGGFGVNSDFSWNIQGGLGYEFSERFALLSVDFDNGKDGTPDFFAYDTKTHGPLIGFVFRF